MSEKGLTGVFSKNLGNVLPQGPSQLEHIFGSRPGHLVDTPRNRQTLLDVANDEDCFAGTDAYGNDWFVKLDTDGSQIWATVRGGVIQNGGRNNPPRSWNGRSGLNNNPFGRR